MSRKVEPCEGLEKLMELGVVEKHEDRLPTKGKVTSFNLFYMKDGKKMPVAIQFCPACGERIGKVENLEIDESCDMKETDSTTPTMMREEIMEELGGKYVRR